MKKVLFCNCAGAPALPEFLTLSIYNLPYLAVKSTKKLKKVFLF
jgi:hypothetical protein